MQTHNLKAIAYNTHLFKGTLAGDFSFLVLKDKERQQAIIKYLLETDADVIGLSEVWSNESKNEFVSALGDKYQQHKVDGYGADNMGSGLLLLSKHSLVDSQFVTYEDACGNDALAQKGFIVTRLWIEGVPAADQPWIYLTHTQSGDDCREDRKLQLTQLAKHYKDNVDNGGGPCLVMGDLNIAADTTEYGVLHEVFPTLADAFKVRHPNAPGFTCDTDKSCLANHFNDGDLPHRFDYFLSSYATDKVKSCEVIDRWKIKATNNDIDCRKVCGNANKFDLDCSDHYPIVANFKI